MRAALCTILFLIPAAIGADTVEDKFKDAFAALKKGDAARAASLARFAPWPTPISS